MTAELTTPTAWTNAAFARVAEVVRDRAGLIFPPNRTASAEGAIRRAMASIGVADVDRYRAIIEDGGAAFDDLMAELTIGETYFFRERSQLEHIRNVVLPSLEQSFDEGRPVRVWSAGCASGEEAFSLAIILHEEGWSSRCRVIGTDVSRPRLAAARRGEYSKWSLRGVEPAVISRYFGRRGVRYSLDPAIRRMVEFHYLNLAEPDWMTSRSRVIGSDIILCRNVLIYFDRDTVAAVAQRLTSALSPDGWLFVGASDPPLAEIAPVDVAVTDAGLAYRRTPGSSWIPQSPIALSERNASPVEREVGRVVAHEPPAPADRDLAVEQLPELPPPLPQAHPEPRNIPKPVAAAWQSRDYGRVITLAERELETSSGDPALWVLLVRALANSGRTEEAAQACAAALERHGVSADLLHLQAVLHLQMGAARDAAASARRALYLDRNMITAHLVLGAALAREGECAGARRAYLNALALAEKLPRDAEVDGTDGETAHRIAQLARVQAAVHSGDR